MDAEDKERLVRIDERTKILLDMTEDQEMRVRSLESSRNWMNGAGAAITAVIGWLLRDSI